ncbi:DEAD/DEAH box helicase [Nocardia niigatensis]
MPEDVAAIESIIREAISPGFRRRLLARGEARGMIWRDGELPADAPAVDPLLSYDLLSYGYALLGNGIRLLEADGDRGLGRQAFENAAIAIEAVIARGAHDDDRGFHRVVAAAAYHLGLYSARAYSLLSSSQDRADTTLGEQCLVLLMLRDLDALSALITSDRTESASDGELLLMLQNIFEPETISDAPDEGTRDVVDVVDMALTDAFVGAMSVAMLAFERGEVELLDEAISRLQTGLNAAGDLNLVRQWWCHRLAIHLLGGLWRASFHTVLPIGPLDSARTRWQSLRAMFIASLFRRRRSEIDLWPSQVEAAARVLNTQESLVLSLPTSAGKTRIAEICILATLAEGKRVVFVTPLRALSAQTEAALERTFVPLGRTVSSLYGTTGVSEVDQDILAGRDIVVATPEKLDFALRNEPSLLDDVGLVVLDEGHMIGENEREVRYEVQVQRLLRRSDADSRRIVCLSAILPDGDQVRDFVDWLTNDQPNGLISSQWRPTTLRYGEIIWQRDHARLNITVGREEPFVPTFLSAVVPPIGKRKKPFPKDQKELCLAAAWRLVADGQTVLIFCPEKRSVKSYADCIVDLNRRGALESVFSDDFARLQAALTIGEEWFGSDHPILECLKLGVAIHHGSLPSPYRKEIERLLQQGVLKVTVSSPTLAQGLNLSASSLIVHSISRSGRVIETSEFRNIVGRAGRAFVDSAGLVLYPMYDARPYVRDKWKKLVEDRRLRDMRSGLMQLVQSLLLRMRDKLGGDSVDIDTLIEYVGGNAAWEFPEISSSIEEDVGDSERKWQAQLASLDCALFGLLSDEDVGPDNSIETALDTALASSLWTRSMLHRHENAQRVLVAGLASRARFLWSHSTASQRRGFFLAGVGLTTGCELAENSALLIQYLHLADRGIIDGDGESVIDAITSFASIALRVYPFAPKKLPIGWPEVLRGWLQGKPMSEIAPHDDGEVLEFIEDSLAYGLPWAMEAVRVQVSAADSIDDLWAVVMPTEGYAVAAVEAGTLDRSAAMLMRAGFSSRSGAIAAVTSSEARFTTMGELREWLRSDEVRELAQDNDWPTSPSHDLWVSFANRSGTGRSEPWVHTVESAQVAWLDGHESNSGLPYRAVSLPDGGTLLETPDAQPAGRLQEALNPGRLGLLTVTGTSATNVVELSYRGPSDLRV